MLYNSNINRQIEDHANNLQIYQFQITNLNKFNDQNSRISIGPKIKQKYQESINSDSSPIYNLQDIPQQKHNNQIKICISDSQSTENQNHLRQNIKENQPLNQNHKGEIKVNLEAQQKLRDQKLAGIIQKILFEINFFILIELKKK
ncbi:hypothetical protein ABPG72_016031 [Tetrahymena utriculariae]